MRSKKQRSEGVPGDGGGRGSGRVCHASRPSTECDDDEDAEDEDGEEIMMIMKQNGNDAVKNNDVDVGVYFPALNHNSGLLVGDGE